MYICIFALIFSLKDFNLLESFSTTKSKFYFQMVLLSETINSINVDNVYCMNDLVRLKNKLTDVTYS